MFAMCNYMNKNIHSNIDFGKFNLLAVIPHSKKGCVVMLTPIDRGSDKHLNLKLGSNNTSRWYTTFDEMISYCRNEKIIGTLRIALIKRRYRKMQKRSCR